MTKEKRVVYLCPGCKKEQTRYLPVAYLTLESYCSSKGKQLTMHRLRWEYA